MTYLIRLPKILTVSMTSMIETAGYKMAAIHGRVFASQKSSSLLL